jgi:osmotically-inducible protein OsmY
MTGYREPDRSGREATNQAMNGAIHEPRGGHRGKGPKNWQRSDERIREAVSEALSDHDEIDATEVEVTVIDGEVTLDGAVADRRMKRIAEDCVDQVAGVRDVQNRLRVAGRDETKPRVDEGPPRSGAGTSVGDRKPRA